MFRTIRTFTHSTRCASHNCIKYFALSSASIRWAHGQLRSKGVQQPALQVLLPQTPGWRCPAQCCAQFAYCTLLTLQSCTHLLA
eukprot:6483419-Amphidinium_carterae.1